MAFDRRVLSLLGADWTFDHNLSEEAPVGNAEGSSDRYVDAVELFLALGT